jgi:hypothetical protein
VHGGRILSKLVIKLHKRRPDCSPGERLVAVSGGRGPSRLAPIPAALPGGSGWPYAEVAGDAIAIAPPTIVDATMESDRKVSAARERNRVLGRGLRRGKSFKVEAEDGDAWYEIIGRGAGSVVVEWRDYGRDRCMDEMLGAGGAFPRPLIQRLVDRHDVLEELSEALA